MKRDGYSGTFDVPANSPLPHRFPYMACYFYVRSAGNSSKKYGRIIGIIGDEIMRLRKILVHRSDDSDLRILCPGAVRPFTDAVGFGNSYGYHQYLTSLLILIVFLMISLY